MPFFGAGIKQDLPILSSGRDSAPLEYPQGQLHMIFTADFPCESVEDQRLLVVWCGLQLLRWRQAVPKEGSYSGYKCSQQATYFPWITEEACTADPDVVHLYKWYILYIHMHKYKYIAT